MVSGIGIICGLAIFIFGSIVMIVASWRRMIFRNRVRSVALLLMLFFAFQRVLFENISAWQLGGFASAGKIENGKYFLGNHGKYTEVPQARYKFNLMYDDLSDFLADGSIVLLFAVLLATGFFRGPNSGLSVESIIGGFRSSGSDNQRGAERKGEVGH